MTKLYIVFLLIFVFCISKPTEVVNIPLSVPTLLTSINDSNSLDTFFVLNWNKQSSNDTLHYVINIGFLNDSDKMPCYSKTTKDTFVLVNRLKHESKYWLQIIVLNIKDTILSPVYYFRTNPPAYLLDRYLLYNFNNYDIGDKANYLTIYDYSKANVIRERYYDLSFDTTYGGYATFRYDQKGNVQDKYVYSKDSILFNYYNYYYDLHGNVIKQAYYNTHIINEIDSNVSYYAYVYDSNENVLMASEITKDSVLMGYANYEYLNANQLIKATYYGNDNRMISYEKFDYDSYGNLILITKCFPNGPIIGKFAYEYKKYGSFAKSRYFAINNGMRLHLNLAQKN